MSAERNPTKNFSIENMKSIEVENEKLSVSKIRQMGKTAIELCIEL